jgi:hypothetical protein
MRHYFVQESPRIARGASPLLAEYAQGTWPHKLSARTYRRMHHKEQPGLFFPDAAQKIRQWRFNGEFGKGFQALCEVQMWCFGCDIRRKSGNLLTRYGFTRSKSSANSYGTSLYSKDFPCGFSLYLCGFAIVAAYPSATNTKAALLIRRFDSMPRLLPTTNALSQLCTPQDVAHAFIPSDELQYEDALTLFRKLAQELSQYERFIEEETESGYRGACISAAPRRYRTIDSRSLGSLWSELCLP